MTANVAQPTVDGFRFPADRPACRIVTRQPVNWFSNGRHSLAVLGHLRVDNDAGALDSLAAACGADAGAGAFYDRLSGAFCLLVVDHADDSIALVSDVMGIQSCYFTIENGELLLSESLDLLR